MHAHTHTHIQTRTQIIALVHQQPHQGSENGPDGKF